MRVRRRVMIGAAAIAATLTIAGCTGPDGSGSSATQDPTKTSAPFGSSPASEDQVSAILVQPIHAAQVVRGTDGKNHVEYELLIINAFSDPVTLKDVTVVGPNGKDLTRIEGKTLAAATQTLYTHTPSAVVAASAAVVVEVDLALPAGDDVPEHVSHRIEYTLPSGVAGAVIIDDTVVHGPKVDVNSAKATVIAPPLAGDGWLFTSACCSPNVHRDLRLSAGGLRLATAETFAVDWAKVKGDGDGSRNEQFYDFGVDVLAVGNGTVVSVNDGVEESIPFASKAPAYKEGFGGNNLMLKIADNVYAAYAHLQPGSFAVHVGDKVKTGQVLAKLGNTGPSQGPHLHFGLLDKPDLFTGQSLPFVFKKFTLIGTVDFEALTGDELVISRESHEMSNAYPLYGTIVDFP